MRITKCDLTSSVHVIAYSGSPVIMTVAVLVCMSDIGLQLTRGIYVGCASAHSLTFLTVSGQLTDLLQSVMNTAKYAHSAALYVLVVDDGLRGD